MSAPNTLPTVLSRPVWAQNTNWAAGPNPGSLTKIQPPNAYLSEGIEPGGAGATQAQGIAEYENWWRNQQDTLQLFWREYLWNTVRGTVFDASILCAIARAGDGQRIAVYGSPSSGSANVITHVVDGAPNPFPSTGITYTAESTGVKFMAALAPDIPPDGTHGPFVVCGTYGATSDTAHNISAWQVDFNALTVTRIGDSAGLIGGGSAFLDRLVRCVGGYAYAFKTGGSNFYRLSPTVMIPGAGGTNLPQIVDPGFSPSSLTNAHLAAAVIGGFDTICQVDWNGTNPVIKIAKQPYSTILATTTSTKTVHGISVAWVADFGAFLVLYADGSIDAVNPTSGVVSMFSPAPGLLETMIAGKITNQGWLALGTRYTYRSSNFFFAQLLQMTPKFSALSTCLYDGSAWWIPNDTASSQGSMQRTLYTL